MTGDLQNLLAVVVTHHPDKSLGVRLESLRAQAASVLVVDNGSRDFAAVEYAAGAAGCRVIRNRANLGVAGALNQAACLALDEGFEWLATFDQDSLAPPGAIADLLALHARHPCHEEIAILAMSHRDRATGRDYHRPGDILEEAEGWRSVRATITSGSLTRCDLLDRLGMFDEGLFIDGVDHDLCLRCRQAGWLIVEARSPVMEHSLGAITHRRFLWRSVPCSNHSPDRRYYITRNTLELCVRHFASDFAWSVRTAGHLVVASLAVVMLEEERLAKLGAIAEGVLHFALRRFGPRGGLPEPLPIGD